MKILNRILAGLAIIILIALVAGFFFQNSYHSYFLQKEFFGGVL